MTAMMETEGTWEAEAKRDRSPLEERVAALEQAIGRTAKAAAMLDQRLRAVSAMDGPEPSGPEQSVPEEVLPEHHSDLRRLTGALNREAARLEDTLDRLRV